MNIRYMLLALIPSISWGSGEIQRLAFVSQQQLENLPRPMNIMLKTNELVGVLFFQGFLNLLTPGVQ